MRVKRGISNYERYWYIEQFPGHGFVYVHKLKTCYICTKSHNHYAKRALPIAGQEYFKSIHDINAALEA